MRVLRNSGFVVFGYREYLLFWIAAAFANVGMWTLVYGRMWLMRSLTESEILLGLVAFSTLAPVMFLSMWGGVLADRINRLRLLRFTRFLFAAAGFLTGTLIATDLIEVWHLLAISTFTGILLAFDIPARSAMVASIVPKEQLPSAISLYSIVFGGAAILGPTLFHPLVSAIGMEGLFFIISASYVLTVVTLLRMDHQLHFALVREQPTDTATKSSFTGAIKDRASELVEGLRYVRFQKSIAAVIGYGIVIGLIGSPFETLLPVVTEEVFNGDSATYGQLLLFIGIGGIIATLTITLIGARAKPPLYLAIGGIATGTCFVAFSLVGNLIWALPIASAVGLFSVVKGTMSNTVVQTLVSDEFRGRVLSLMMFTWGAQAVGALVSGVLAQLWGAPFAIGASGALAIIATIVVWRAALRHI